MALDAGTAFVQILPQTSKFGPILNAEVNSAAGQTEARFAKFKAVGALAMVAVGAAVVKFGADSIAAYKESEVVLGQLQNAIAKSPQLIGETTAAFQKQATELQNLTGVQDEEILSADTVLSRFKLTGDQIRETIPLVLDYARASGKDVPSAAVAVGKALLGNTRALKELGISYAVTGDASKDLANIQDLLAQKVGGAAEAFGKTAAGKMEIFRAKLDDVQEGIGKALIPVVDQLVSVLGALLPVVTPLLQNVVLLGGAFLAFKAATFLPSLLLSIGVGMKGIGAGGAAEALGKAAFAAQSFGAALRTVLPGLGILAVLGFELVKSYGQQQETIASLSQTIVKYGSDSKQGAIAVEQLGQATSHVGDRSAIANRYTSEFQATIVTLDAAHGRLKTSIDAAVVALDKEADASHRTTDAILAQRGATDALAGGLLGLVSSARSAHDANLSLSAAQKKVNEDIKKGKQGTQDYRDDLNALHDAQFNALQGQLSFHAALTSYAQTLRGPVAKAQEALIAATNKETNAKYTVEQKTLDVAAATKALTDAQHGLAPAQQKAINLLRDMGVKAGLTKAQVDALIGKVLGLSGAIDKVPNAQSTKFSAPGLDDVNGKLGELLLKQSRVQYHNEIFYVIKTLGNVPQGPPVGAHGGAFKRFAEGSLFLGPPGVGPFIAGEASYPTPLGRGAEIASSAGVLPLNADMIGRLGRAIAEAGGQHRGPSAQEYAAALWPLIAEIGKRPIVVQVDRRTIARAVESDALWSR